MTSAQVPVKRENPRKSPAVIAKYALLLPLILVNLVVFGFEDQHPPMRSVSHWLATATLLLALYVSRVGRAYFLAVGFLALVAAAALTPARAQHGLAEIVVVVTFGALIAIAPIAILRRVRWEFAEGGVDSEVLAGALCAYLYIGNWYAFLYRSLAILSKGPFFAQPGADDALNYLYFSFVTLATVGYGDLSPAFGPGRMLAATEGIVGQLYLVSVVAIVVSAYGRGKAPPPERETG
ncbi:MAG: Ion transport 2 domain protein [candidate division NC10 bacterium]|nr:Ion transport 2 domain protein [candidate division NC10 bacterium]